MTSLDLGIRNATWSYPTTVLFGAGTVRSWAGPVPMPASATRWW